MRISDWSSDVCSSDLVGQTYAIIARSACAKATGNSSHWSDLPLIEARAGINIFARNVQISRHKVLHGVEGSLDRLDKLVVGFEAGALNDYVTKLIVWHRLGAVASLEDFRETVAQCLMRCPAPPHLRSRKSVG